MLGFDRLHEKGWFKSLAALVAFLVSIMALTTALTSFLNRQERPAAMAAGDESAAAPVAAPAPAQAPGQRTLDDALRQRLARELKDKDAGISVMCARQDPEAARYGREILSHLKEAGYTNAHLAFVPLPSSFRGVEIAKDSRKAFIRVGHR